MDSGAYKPELHFDTVDVFTTKQFNGNPLAVVHVPPTREDLSHAEKQRIAKEFNLAETVFLRKTSGSIQNEYAIEYFTTSQEIPIAGHPTIGAAWLIGAHHSSPDPNFQIAMSSKAGLIEVEIDRTLGLNAMASARMPHDIHMHKERLSQKALEILQPSLCQTNKVKESSWPVVSLTRGLTFVLVEVDSMETLSKVTTSPKKFDVVLDEEWQPSFVGTYFYYLEESEYNVRYLHTRMVEPAMGEDAVTGSAACTLAAYLAMGEGEDSAFTDFEYHVTQGEHYGRPGCPVVSIRMTDTGLLREMTLKGTAVRMSTGSLLQPS